MATIVNPDWCAKHLAVHHEYLIGQSDQSELALVRHPSYPFLAEISDDPSRLFDELRCVAECYLTRVGYLDQWLARAVLFLKEEKPEGFGWLPITWGLPAGLIDPRGSFAVRRCRDDYELDRTDDYELDRTIVMMACNRSLKENEIRGVDGLAVGLRVVLHIDPTTNGTSLPIRVTGTSMSELRRADPPTNGTSLPIRVTGTSMSELRGTADLGSSDPERFPRLELLLTFLEQSLDFLEGTTQLNGVERLSSTVLRVAGVGARRGPFEGAPRGFLWSIDVEFDEARQALSVFSVREQEQRTFAARAESSRYPRLFYRDPASCGAAGDIRSRLPTRDEEVLDHFREDAPSLPRRLEDDGRFQVLQSVVADPENSALAVQSIDPLKLPLRSDHLSAAQAFLRAWEFFDWLRRFELPEPAYFKFARLPLQMRHRAYFDAHPDGKAVIAQVRVVGKPMPMRGKYEPATQPQLEVAFGSAALRHRSIHPNDHGHPTAQPLGVAADPRWAWHEFGHVLSYAATGALEYEFAHSVGDALAAVLNDATSCLAGEGLYDGETYPWVPAGRRHDRDAAAGWCWCGRRNGQRHATPTFPPQLYKGYVEEQMLSSSVFRFYRAIGGHPSNDAAMRKRAAAAAAYLLMRSALLLGPGAMVPARSADALVSAMVDADIGTRQPGQLFLGGCLHKVLRWSFERQGLFATASPEKDVEGTGLPPKVDLWVMDRRPNAEDGGYEPVTLEWPTVQPEPDWFADPREGHGVWKDACGNIHLVVRNRGAYDATHVVARAWLAPIGLGPLHWRYLGDDRLAVVRGGDSASARIAAGLSGGNYYLLVEVSARADASNLDAETRLPCASGTPPDGPEAVRDLVANDNNLALRLIS